MDRGHATAEQQIAANPRSTLEELERLRAENAGLINQCECSAEHCDKQALTIKELRAALYELADREWVGEEKSWRTEALEMRVAARTALANVS